MPKLSTKNSKMRTAYYEVADKLPELTIQSKNLSDEDLVKLAKQLEEKLEEFRKILDEKYLWD